MSQAQPIQHLYPQNVPPPTSVPSTRPLPSQPTSKETRALSDRKFTKPWTATEKLLLVAFVVTVALIVISIILAAHHYGLVLICCSVVGGIATAVLLRKRCSDKQKDYESRKEWIEIDSKQWQQKLSQYNGATPAKDMHLKCHGHSLTIYSKLNEVPRVGMEGEEVFVRKETFEMVYCYKRTQNGLVLVKRDIPVIVERYGSVYIPKDMEKDLQELEDRNVFKTWEGLKEFLYKEETEGYYVFNGRIHHTSQPNTPYSDGIWLANKEPPANGMYEAHKSGESTWLGETQRVTFCWTIPTVIRGQDGSWIVPREMVMPDTSGMPLSYTFHS